MTGAVAPKAPKYKIRKARPEESIRDRNALLRLQLDTLPADHVVDPIKGHWWLAFDEHNFPVGFCGMQRKGVKSAYLVRAGVLEAHRGHGLQRQFLRLREKAAKRMGVTRIATNTIASNVPSSNNLIRSGYELYEPANPYGGYDTLYWHKRL